MDAPRPMPTGERLARIEQILEGAFHGEGTVPVLARDVKSIKDDLAADVADLAKLKHRGAGILVGVSIASAAFGAALNSHIKAVIESVFGQ